MSEIRELLKKRILVLDGAMGTSIQNYNLSESDFRGDRFSDFEFDLKGNNDLLSITKPQVIERIHESFVLAGADIIETNTFNANSISMEDYGMSDLVYELNFESARLAKKVAKKYSTKDKKIFVAGAIGPTNKTASMSPKINNPEYREVDFDKFVEVYTEQIEALLKGGVDVLLIETVFDTLNAKACMFAIQSVFERQNIDIPVMVSGTITDASGRTLSGQTAEAFLISVSHMNLLSIGFNCALGAKQLIPHIEILSKKSNFAISAHPNAGLPNAFGEYDESPEIMTNYIKEYLDNNLVNIIGGCCGTTPNHIKSISELVKKYSPREL